MTPPDFDEWYALHMGQIENFKSASVRSEVMYRDRNDPGTMVGVLQVDDVDKFLAWLSTQQGPIRFKPTLWVLDEVEKTI